MIPLTGSLVTDEKETKWLHVLVSWHVVPESGSMELSAENKQACWQEILLLSKFRALVIHIYVAAIAV